MDVKHELRLIEAQERIATALEGIERELRQAREDPLFAPMGLAVVDEDSPVVKRAQLIARMQQGGMSFPGTPPS